MTTHESAASSAISTPRSWVRLLLGVVLILAGLFVLGDAAMATIVSTLLIGFTAIAAGTFEIIHAFWTKGWGGFIWQLVLGILYIAFGAMIVNQPASGALILTFFLGLVLIASGAVRIVWGVRHWRSIGWIMVLSGIFGCIAGLIILVGWPLTGLWVLGVLLGIDLISHGLAWLTYGWLPSSRAA